MSEPCRRSRGALSPATCAALLAAATLLACRATESAERRNERLVATFTSATNDADWEALGELLTEDFARHSAATEGPPVESRAQFVALQRGFLASFPDQRVELRHVVADGDYVAVLATYSGTHRGALGGVPATGRSVRVPFLALFRVEAGRIAELWVEWDNVTMLRQLGLFPAPGDAPAE